MKVKISEVFEEIINNYCRALGDWLSCEPTKEPDIRQLQNEHNQKIKDYFRKVSEEEKIYYLYFFLKKMSEPKPPNEDPRLTDWCRRLAFEMTDELEKIEG